MDQSKNGGDANLSHSLRNCRASLDEIAVSHRFVWDLTQFYGDYYAALIGAGYGVAVFLTSVGIGSQNGNLYDIANVHK